MQAMHSQPPTRYSLTLSIKGLLSGDTKLMSNIISTNDNLQLVLGFRIRNRGNAAAIRWFLQFLGCTSGQLGQGGAGRGCIVRRVAIGLNMRRALTTCAQDGKRRLLVFSKEGLGLRLPPVGKCPTLPRLVRHGHLSGTTVHCDPEH